MNSKRLTKNQKNQILKAYIAGDTANELAEKYNCSSNTINRNVKALLTEGEYASIKEKRLEKSRVKSKINSININNSKIDKIGIEESDENDVFSSEIKNPCKGKSFKPNALNNDSQFTKEDSKEFYEPSDQDQDIVLNNSDSLRKTNQIILEEIVPLVVSFDFENDKQKVALQVLDEEVLPDIVYMIVDKKVEIEPQLISDLPEWSFLPEDELKRLAIVLFPNQRSAKRNCSRNQRVIKVPNTEIFSLSKPYLLSKGITRLILEDSFIALD